MAKQQPRKNSTMSIITPSLSPGKGRWPKSQRKRAVRRYLFEAASEYKRARLRQLGTFGPASPVRRIDPKAGKVIEVPGGPDPFDDATGDQTGGCSP